MATVLLALFLLANLAFARSPGQTFSQNGNLNLTKREPVIDQFQGRQGWLHNPTGPMEGRNVRVRDRPPLEGAVHVDLLVYEIWIEPHFEEWTFTGRALIWTYFLQGANSKDWLKVRADGLNMTSWSLNVTSSEGTFYHMTENDDVEVIQDEYSIAFSLAFLGAETMLYNKLDYLEIKYTGKIYDKDDPYGLFRVEYPVRLERWDPNYSNHKSTHYLAMQLEPFGASRVFPHFDQLEPLVQFRINLAVDQDLTCFGNRRSLDETILWSGSDGIGRKEVGLWATYDMPFYSAAFVVGNFTHIETNEARVPITIWAGHGVDLSKARFVLDLAVKALGAIDKIYAVNPEVEDIRFVAVYGMEWGAIYAPGLITIGQEWLVVDELSSLAWKQRVAEMVVQSMSHILFGGSTTMSEWKYLWLREGLATFATKRIMASLFPEWDLSTAVIGRNREAAFATDDVSILSHPVEFENPRYDPITSDKAAAIMGMLERATNSGDDNIWRGLHAYLYGNTRASRPPQELWDRLSDATGKDVASIGNPWMENSGYPILSVEEDGDTITLEQHPHRVLGKGRSVTEEDPAGPLWPIPLLIKTSLGVDTNFVMTSKKVTIRLGESIGFYLMNAGGAGFFRVSYPGNRLNTLSSQMQKGQEGISDADAISFLYDTLALTFTGYKNIINLMGVLSDVGGWETNLLAHGYWFWAGALDIIKSIRSIWINDSYRGLMYDLNDMIQYPCEKLVEARGWGNAFDIAPGDSDLEKRFKALIFEAMGIARRDVAVKAFAKSRFWDIVLGGNRGAVDPNLRAAVLKIGVLEGALDEYNALWDYYRSDIPPEDKEAAIAALGAREKSLDKTLNLVFSNDIRDVDRNAIVTGVLDSGEYVNGTISWLMSSWEKMVDDDRVDTGFILAAVASKISMEDRWSDFKAWMGGRQEWLSDQRVAAAMEVGEIISSWTGRERDSLYHYLGYYDD